MEVVPVALRHGRAWPVAARAATIYDEDNGHDKAEDGCQTRSESKRKLKVFMGHIVMGKHDQPLTHMARHTSSATNFDLGCEGMKHVQQLFSEIWALYNMDFPNTSDSNSTALPSTELHVALLIAGEYTPAHVKAYNSIESEEAYHEKNVSLPGALQEISGGLHDGVQCVEDCACHRIRHPDNEQEVGSCLFQVGAWSQVVHIR